MTNEASVDVLQETAEPAEAVETPEERIATLLDNMKTRRRTLLGLIAFCETPQAVSSVNTEVEILQEDDASVYGAYALCMMLEKAGALAKKGDGRENEPELVEIDGVECWKPSSSEPCLWQATPEGLAAVAADDPSSRLKGVLEKDAGYEPVFLKVLELCARDGGASADELDAEIDGDPLVQNPRRYALYFYDKLADCGCIEWKGSWVITDFGRDAGRVLRTGLVDKSNE